MAELRAIDPEPLGKSVIDVLEHVLAKAKAGELSSVAVAYIHRDAAPGWNWSEVPNSSTLIGAIERLKHDLIGSVDD